ncbi:MAG: phage Gp37/Gp68 family protein [Ignavibacteria bacterium]
MSQSSIEWTQMTWNPTTGCNKLSPGCKFCYALTMTKRLEAMGLEKYKNGFKLTVHPDTLSIPYQWKKPKTVFVNSMSDLFHKDIPLEYLMKVFKVMNDNLQHTFQILTKRADVLAKYDLANLINWTPNIWMGVSVENDRVTERIDFLRNTRAKIKFLSLEPLIGPLTNLNLKNIDWVIVGGESGFKARPVMKDWIVEIRDQCKKSRISFFFKQWGKAEFNTDQNDPTIDSKHSQHAKGGCMLNGKTYRELPLKKTIS